MRLLREDAFGILSASGDDIPLTAPWHTGIRPGDFLSSTICSSKDGRSGLRQVLPLLACCMILWHRQTGAAAPIQRMHQQDPGSHACTDS